MQGALAVLVTLLQRKLVRVSIVPGLSHKSCHTLSFCLRLFLNLYLEACEFAFLFGAAK